MAESESEFHSSEEETESESGSLNLESESSSEEENVQQSSTRSSSLVSIHLIDLIKEMNTKLVFMIGTKREIPQSNTQEIP